MGGLGSGTWIRKESKRLTEEALCLDINMVARRKLLTTEPHWFQWRNARAAVEIFRGESVEEPILFLRYTTA